MGSGCRAIGGAILVLLAAVANASEPAPSADAIADDARSGWYAGLSILAGINTFERTLEANAGFDVSTNETIGVGGRVGYRFAPRFAVEGQVEWMNPFKAEADTICSDRTPLTSTQRPPGLSAGVAATLPCLGHEVISPTIDPIRTGDPYRIEPIVATLNARGYLATGRWQPYMLFGSGLMYLAFDDEATCKPLSMCGRDVELVSYALRVGGGLEYYMTERFVLTLGASYVLPLTGAAKDFDYVSIEPFGITYRFR
jgi:opacity protein-like surface antigen